jgi:hypothetical protein
VVEALDGGDRRHAPRARGDGQRGRARGVEVEDVVAGAQRAPGRDRRVRDRLEVLGARVG